MEQNKRAVVQAVSPVPAAFCAFCWLPKSRLPRRNAKLSGALLTQRFASHKARRIHHAFIMRTTRRPGNRISLALNDLRTPACQPPGQNGRVAARAGAGGRTGHAVRARTRQLGVRQERICSVLDDL